MKIYIGMDNGTSGSIGIIKETGDYYFIQMPKKTEKSYTKKDQNITRIDIIKLKKELEKYINFQNDQIRLYLERPFTNAQKQFIKAVISGMRALEAITIFCEQNNISLEICDSKSWQKLLLPIGIKKGETKKASLDIATRKFPLYKDLYIKQKDGDGILIAEYCRRKEQ
jgi:hypothetical protein